MSSIGYMSRNHKDLVVLLQREEKEAGITQANLAEAVQVSRKSINAIENGRYVPSTVLSIKIATVLNCKIEDIFKLHEGTFPFIKKNHPRVNSWSW